MKRLVALRVAAGTMIKDSRDRVLTMVDVDKIKKQLEQRLDFLGARIEEIKSELRSRPSADFEEQATEGEGDEVLEGLENSGLSEIAQIHAALDRMKTGEYGECLTCGEPIGEKRLEAIPYATQCIKCASLAD
jgi:RNA polymerase-binding transcription factor DksA